MELACQVCKKQRATVHLTEILPQGEKCERHLCEACAQNEGVMPKPTAGPVLSQLLTTFLEGGKASAQQLAELRCPECETSFVEFRSNGLLGCPSDYDAFEKALAPLIQHAHQEASRHIGKIPRRLGAPREVESDLLRLRRELSRAVDDERYELAAKLRDDIRSLEAKA